MKNEKQKPPRTKLSPTLIFLGSTLYMIEPLIIFIILYHIPTNYIMNYYKYYFNYTITLPLLIMISGTLTLTNRPFIRTLGSTLTIILAYVNLFTTPIGIGFIPTIIGATQRL